MAFPYYGTTGVTPPSDHSGTASTMTPVEMVPWYVYACNTTAEGINAEFRKSKPKKIRKQSPKIPAQKWYRRFERGRKPR